MLWPWPLTYDLEKLIRSGHYHYQCVYQIWEQSIPWFLSYRVNTIAGGGRLPRKTITSPDPSDTGDIINWDLPSKMLHVTVYNKVYSGLWLEIYSACCCHIILVQRRVNSLCLSDAICHHRSASTLDEEMTCCQCHDDVQYIPRNMHTVLLCFALLWLCNRS